MTHLARLFPDMPNGSSSAGQEWNHGCLLIRPELLLRDSPLQREPLLGRLGLWQH